jgi:hypothetical protein
MEQHINREWYIELRVTVGKIAVISEIGTHHLSWVYFLASVQKNCASNTEVAQIEA